jgi:hypothetical protein
VPDTLPTRTAAADPERLTYIKELLARYPRISGDEKDDIVRYLKKGPALDTALLTSIEAIKPKLERFREDHRRHFGVGPKAYVVIVILIAVILVVFALLWDAGLSR